ncbi:MAG: 50S ribosomal protein L11 methyltransferase [Pseudomonadota bacterium]
MFQITARGDRADIETAWDALAWSDPTPAQAVDGREETRLIWRLVAYAETADQAQACADLIRETSPQLAPSISALPDRDWVTLSLEGLPPVEAGRFVVAGHHALTQRSPGRTGILIEAGPAFGTGHHGTTLGCLQGFEHVLRRRVPKRVLDVGTGSGVLAIAALKTGSELAIGTDIDAESVRVTRENASKNNVARRMTAYVVKGTRLSRIRATAPYDLIFANILARPLIRLAGELVPLIEPGGHIVLSGLLNHQAPLVLKAYLSRGLILRKRIRIEGWTSLVLQRPASP